MIQKIISGGQTGVDRAALDFAIKQDIPYGGWCPKGRLDENGVIPSQYTNLKEVPCEFTSDAENYAARTIANIKDSDGTLILVPSIPLPDEIKDGTVLTLEESRKHKKPHLLLSLSEQTPDNASLVLKWIDENAIKVLNIAGPRESSCPWIYGASLRFLKNVITFVQNMESSIDEKK